MTVHHNKAAATDTLSVDVIAPMPPLMLRGAQAAAAFGVAGRTWRKWNSAGLIPKGVRIGRVLLWDVGTLTRWRDENCPTRERFSQITKVSTDVR